MTNDGSIGLISVIALVMLNAIITAAQTAFVNVRKAPLRELAEAGNKRAERVLALSEDATRLLTTRQLITILLHFFAAVILVLTLGQPLIAQLQAAGMAQEQARWLVYLSVSIIGALLMLLVGELLPAAVASTRPDGLAMLTVGPMTLLLRIMFPITRALLWIGNRLAFVVGGDANTSYVTEEEIKTLVDAGSEEGVIEDEEKEMIYSIFQFGDKVAREVMLPRIDIVALDAEAALSEALDLIVKEGHSRIPIYEGTIDKICGLLYAKDLLVIWRDGQSKERIVREIMRPAYFVPESKKAGSLLEELQQRKIQMAIVIDEYGGTAGLITTEDLIEEIVGEIQDEYDPDEEADYHQISENEYVFDAGISLDDVKELLSIDLPDDESDTLGGYVLRVLDRVPLGGEVFTERGLEIKVEAITGRRIRKVRVKVLSKPSAEEAAPERKPDADLPDTSAALPKADSDVVAHS